MSANKAPSAGTKVEPGANAPVASEATGRVDSGSLAAESASSGGAFASNAGVQSGSSTNNSSSNNNNSSSNNNNSSSNNNSSFNNNSSSNDNSSSANKSSSTGTDSSSANKSSSTGTGSAPGSGTSSIPSKAGTAPTYVNNQYIRDPAGPHGKNITEGFDDKNTKDGVQAAFKAEVGSENDPGRAAEQGFLQSQTKAGRDAGPRQTEVDGQTVYDNLKSDVEA
ncbi:hypothetical protein C8035_v002908 [Colletotrichum spinosum]|uniref:Uncharacterized protein n=1 Tax=Colletotrichum spinosum TaxID=1347390 RepID=A0A4R8PWV1_9PEZI|nr:hypothetical protein C8035_v002908 [Colletotrichum spinosum]